MGRCIYCGEWIELFGYSCNKCKTKIKVAWIRCERLFPFADEGVKDEV